VTPRQILEVTGMKSCSKAYLKRNLHYTEISFIGKLFWSRKMYRENQ